MTETELLNKRLEELERKEAIEELRRDHNWCGIHNCQLINGQYYYYQLQGNMFQGTTNTIPIPPSNYTSGVHCPKCAEAREDRRKELLRKLGHEW